MRTFLARHWFLLSLGFGLLLALYWPDALRLATAYWEPNLAVAASLFLIALTMPSGALAAELRSPWAAGWAVVLSYGLVPLAAFALGLVTAEQDVRIGLILIACVPCTLSSAVIWTRLAGGNEATALLAVMGTTFTSWFLTTAWLLGLTGAEVQLDIGDMVVKLVLTLIVPVLAAQALRLLSAIGRVVERHKPALGAVSQLFTLAIVLKAGVGVGDKLRAQGAAEVPALLGWSAALAVVLHLLAVAAGMLTGRLWGFDRGRQIAIAFAASQKTLPVSLMLYDQYFQARFPFAVVAVVAYHIGQLLLDTVIATRISKRTAI